MKSFFLILILASNIFAQNIPWESSLLKGELKNKFKYTIKKNPKPAKKLELKLVLKAGALEEDDDQEGVAHLIEHMAFNGTRNFEKNSLIEYLESIGVPFGKHLNASTGTNRTIYDLSIPLENDNLDKAFLIFKDWAEGINFNQKEIKKEKGVVLEEKRKRNDIFFRAGENRRPVLYANSKYAFRNIIGTEQSIKNMSVKRIKEFYKDWYRPEFMHLIVVGDFKDEKEIEKKIKKTFSSLKNLSKRQKPLKIVPLVKKRRYLFNHDKELPSNNLFLYYFKERKKLKTIEDFKNNFIRHLAIGLFNNENASQLTKKHPIAKKIKAHIKKIGINQEALVFKSSYQGMRELEALNQLSKSIFKITKFGFDKNDFQALIKSLIKKNEESFEKLFNTHSSIIASSLANSAIYDDIVIDRKEKYKILKKFIPKITLEDINKVFVEMINTKAQLIEYNLYTKNKVSKRAINKTIKNAKKNVKLEKKSLNLSQKLLKTKLQSKKIKAEKYNKKFDFWELTLANDIKIIFKKNDYDKNNVFLHSFSKGGYSTVEDKDFFNAKYAEKIIEESGIGKYSKKDISRINAGKSFEVSPYISRFSEGFSAEALNKDFETMLKMLYLYHKEYTIKDNILNNRKSIFENNLKQSNKTAKEKFFKEYLETYYKKNKRFTKEEIVDIKALNKKTMLKIYKDRFEDANNFTYIILGDIEYEKVKKLTSIYLANLPVKKRKEKFIDRNNNYLKGKNSFIRNYETKNISTLTFSFKTKAKHSKKQSISFYGLKDILHVKLRELIREEKSAVYDIAVSADFIRIPKEEAIISFSFTCDPKRKEEVYSYVQRVIKNLKTKQVEKKYLNAYVKKDLESFKQSQKQNLFWFRHLKDYANFNDDLNEINKYKAYYKSLKLKDIKKAAIKYLNENEFIYTELNPKKIQK